MFRIIFDPKTSRFVVQIIKWGLFWRTCMNSIDGVPVSSRRFETYVEARHWVNSIGLTSACLEQDQKAVYS